MPRLACVACLVASVLLAAGAVRAAPVDAGTDTGADPFELARRWTLAALAPQPVAAPAPLAPAAPAAGPRAPQGPAGPLATPDPTGYALMGLLLLAAGLVAHRARPARPQRRG